MVHDGKINNDGVGAATTAPPPTYVVTSSGGCCAAPGASNAAIRVRRISIAIIIFNAIALVTIGFILWVQWCGSLTGIIMASVLLCVFNKCCYISAAISFAIGGLFNLYAMIIWIRIAQAFNDITEGSAYSNSTWGHIAGGLAVPPAISAFTMFLGSALAVIAVMNWTQNEAHDAPIVLHHQTLPSGGTGAVIHGANHSYPATAIEEQRPQPHAYSV